MFRKSDIPEGFNVIPNRRRKVFWDARYIVISSLVREADKYDGEMSSAGQQMARKKFLELAQEMDPEMLQYVLEEQGRSQFGFACFLGNFFGTSKGARKVLSKGFQGL